MSTSMGEKKIIVSLTIIRVQYLSKENPTSQNLNTHNTLTHLKGKTSQLHAFQLLTLLTILQLNCCSLKYWDAYK